MVRLAQDPELRAAAENLMKELSEAGIQIDPQQALQALKTCVALHRKLVSRLG